VGSLGTRFWSKVKKTDSCWLWTASRTKKGYGRFGTGRAHRASFEAANGKIPPGKFVLHRCDVPACVNPKHLFLGTHSENMEDKYAKGRQIKLTPDKVIAIRKDRRTLEAIAADYGIHFTTVWAIRQRKIWAHVG
jgi:hypothetical protein